ncbi:MAG: CIA30 family protein [Phycisphaerales bacterium]|nr:CIA30 family protein [Phycisphaerales bacterium]
MFTLATFTSFSNATPELIAPTDSWRVVLDGVMGGRSSGRIRESATGTVVFSGDLSLENNGGFSQIRKNIDVGSLQNQDGIEIRVLGDGRTYQFDIRVSNVRLMAGGFQSTFETIRDEWQTIRIPFSDFRLYSFGRQVPRAPEMDPAKIESIGMTLSDKNPGGFQIEIKSIRSYNEDDITSNTIESDSNGSLGEVAESAGLNTLLNLVTLSGLSLPEGEQYTIFAPTDKSFAALSEKTLALLTSEEGKPILKSILSYHIVAGELRSSDLLNRRTSSTLNGQTLQYDTDGGITVSGASVQVVDVPFNGGVVHVIDSVLIPESKSIIELALETHSLSTLVTAITAAGIADQIGSENGPFTVFAPVNSAFASLPEGVLEGLLESTNRTSLIDTLGLHIVPGRVMSNQLLNTKRARSFFGNTIEFGLSKGQLQVQGASIIKADIQAANGVIHFIDKVITKSESPKIINVSMNKEAIRIYELAINRGVPLYNEGQESACASVYEIAIESLIALGSDTLDRRVIERLEMGLAEAESENADAERAWIYRRALDSAYERLSNR